jgi:hypothetical protein
MIGFNDLWTTHPKLCEELMNKEDGYKYTVGSQKKIWWVCKLGHKFIDSIYHRSSIGCSCPYCSGHRILIGFNDLSTTHSYLLNKWDYNKNKIKPTEITFGSHEKIWFLCKDYKHSYKVPLKREIRQNIKCPYCSGKRVLLGFNDIWTTNPQLCKELVNKEDGYKVTRGSGKKIRWKCNHCNYLWKASPDNRIHQNQDCPKCNKSKGEKEIFKLLSKYNIVTNPQQIFKGCKNIRNLKFDFYLPDYNICIEYQGEFHYEPHWSQSDKEQLKTSQKRDQIKRDFCLKENIKLIEIPYWDIDNIEEILVRELNLNKEINKEINEESNEVI